MSDSESDSKDSNGSQVEYDVFAILDSFFLRLYSVLGLQHSFLDGAMLKRGLKSIKVSCFRVQIACMDVRGSESTGKRYIYVV